MRDNLKKEEEEEEKKQCMITLMIKQVKQLRKHEKR